MYIASDLQAFAQLEGCTKAVEHIHDSTDMHTHTPLRNVEDFISLPDPLQSAQSKAMQMPVGNLSPCQGICDSGPFCIPHPDAAKDRRPDVAAAPSSPAARKMLFFLLRGSRVLRHTPQRQKRPRSVPCALPLSVRLLVPGTGAGTTKLLGLAAAVVGNQQGAVELDKGLLEQVLGVLVDELLVVGDEGLGNGLADGVDLRSVTTTGDADADVDVGELVKADNQERLVNLGMKS